eukprot:1597395-Rhodomonas_salina.1
MHFLGLPRVSDGAGDAFGTDCAAAGLNPFDFALASIYGTALVPHTCTDRICTADMQANTHTHTLFNADTYTRGGCTAPPSPPASSSAATPASA